MAWLEAASLILVTNGIKVGTSQPPRILMMKRVSSSSAFANQYVYPGGHLDPADCSSEWLTRFPAFKEFPVPVSKDRIPLFKKYANHDVPGELSFRLCALRETFEECGLLLCAKSPFNRVTMDSIKTFKVKDWRDWQTKVKKDAFNFISLYEELKLLPDVWSLHEWSNWLTPPILKKRFDTAFFICSVPNFADTLSIDAAELSDALVEPPSYYIQKHMEKAIILGYPQLYESCRFVRFNSLHELEEFYKTRAKEGNLRICGHHIMSDGETYFVLPGDCRHSTEYEGGDKPFEMPSVDGMAEDRGPFHRFLAKTKELTCDIAHHGHVLPITSHWSKL